VRAGPVGPAGWLLRGLRGGGERTVPPIHRRFWRTMRRGLAVLRRDPREGMLPGPGELEEPAGVPAAAAAAARIPFSCRARGVKGEFVRAWRGERGAAGRQRLDGAASRPGLPEPTRRAGYKNYRN
jgi:hypothetical protein